MAESKNLPQAQPAPRLASLLATDEVKKRFEEVLGKRAPQFVSSILAVVKSNKELAACEPTSIISSAMEAASMDLPINKNLGFAWVVPYKDRGVPVAQFQIGWKGIVQLALRSGHYKTINATEVYEGQLIDEDPFTGIMQFRKERTSDKVTGYLLYFRLLNGFEKWCYLSRENAEKHGKKYSKAYARGFGPWVEDFDAMALKTVVKNGLSKWGILSVEMQKAMEIDQGHVVEGEVVGYPDSPNEPVEVVADTGAKPASRLKGMIKSPTPNVPLEEPFPFEKEDATLSDRAHEMEHDK